MNALLNAHFYEVFASGSPAITDPSLFASGGLEEGEISADQADFDRNLQIYTSQYEIATSDNMSAIRTILLNNDAARGNSIITSQQVALQEVANTDWNKYLSFQKTELQALLNLQNQMLSPNQPRPSADQIRTDYTNDYLTLFDANQAFT